MKPIVKLDRKAKRQLALIEMWADGLAKALGGFQPIGVLESAGLLIDTYTNAKALASALRVILNKPETGDEVRQAKALIAREKREAKRRRAA